MQIRSSIIGDDNYVDILLEDGDSSNQGNQGGRMLLNIETSDSDAIMAFMTDWLEKHNYVSINILVGEEKVNEVFQRPYKSVGLTQTSKFNFILSFYN